MHQSDTSYAGDYAPGTFIDGHGQLKVSPASQAAHHCYHDDFFLVLLPRISVFDRVLRGLKFVRRPTDNFY